MSKTKPTRTDRIRQQRERADAARAADREQRERLRKMGEDILRGEIETRQARARVMIDAARSAMTAYQAYLVTDFNRAFAAISEIEDWAKGSPDAAEPAAMRRFRELHATVMRCQSVEAENTHEFRAAEAEIAEKYTCRYLTELSAPAVECVMEVATGTGHGIDRQIRRLREAASEQAGEWTQLKALLEGAVDMAVGETDRERRDYVEAQERARWADRRDEARARVRGEVRS